MHEKTGLILWMHALGKRHTYIYTYRALARKAKNSAFCMNCGIKRNRVSGGTVSPSVGLLGDLGGMPLGKV